MISFENNEDMTKMQKVETIRQAANAIGVSYSTLRRMIANGDFPSPIKLSSRRQGILIAQREAWLEAKASENA